MNSILKYFLIISLFIFLHKIEATEYYVNQSTGNDTNDGSMESPWQSVSHAFSVLQAGDVLNLFGDTYAPFSGVPGGELGNPITIKSVDGERAVITNPSTSNGILITSDNVVIDGLEIGPVKNNGVNIQANYVTVRNCIIHDAGLAVKANTSTINSHILIEYCSMYNFSDIPIFPDEAEKFIIRNNIIFNAASVAMDPGGVQELLIENNLVYNPKQKLGALKIRWGNQEAVTEPNCNGAIVRNNIFLEGNKYTIILASSNGAMVYNNVLMNNLLNDGELERGVVYLQEDEGGPNERNVIKNNIVHINGGDIPSGWPHNALVEAREDMAEYITTHEFDNNLYYKSSGTDYIINGTTLIKKDDVIGWGEGFDLNSIVGEDPKFNLKDSLESPEDFTVADDSPAIDKGVHLTVTVGSGSSEIVTVKDSRYFYGGHGMIAGDKIMIGSDTATVMDRDIEANTITLNKSVTWEDGQPVSLTYSGSAPDIGAYEKGIEKEIANAAGAAEIFALMNESGWITGISRELGLPTGYELSQNFPNPFNPTTTIQFQIPQTEFVSLRVYDILGKEVTTLVNQEMSYGIYNVNFDASQFSSGVYFYTLTAGKFRTTKKLMLIK